MWFLLQVPIMFAVMASNVHWQWTPNGYLAGAIGAGAAFVATLVLNDLLARARKKSGQRARQQRT